MIALNAIPRRTHRRESYGIVIGGPMASSAGKLRTMPRFTKKVLVNGVEVSRGGVSPEDGVTPFLSNCYKTDGPLSGVTSPPYPWKVLSGEGFSYAMREWDRMHDGYFYNWTYDFKEPCLAVVRDLHDGFLNVSIYGTAYRVMEWEWGIEHGAAYEEVSHVEGIMKEAVFTFKHKIDTDWKLTPVPEAVDRGYMRSWPTSFGNVKIEDIDD